MLTRQQITREERDRMVELARYNFASEQLRLAEMSRQMVRFYLKARRDRIGDHIARRKYRLWALQWLADARVRTWDARRLGWRLP